MRMATATVASRVDLLPDGTAAFLGGGKGNQGEAARVASRVISLPAVRVSVRSQGWKPAFSIRTLMSPGGSFRVEGVVPTNLSLTRMSAASGVDLMVTAAVGIAGGA